MKESIGTIRFPEQLSLREMNTLFREIPLADTTSRLLRKYFVGMANLYGILPLFSASPESSQKQERYQSQSIKKIGRNAPCPCGSGKKYKHCCG